MLGTSKISEDSPARLDQRVRLDAEHVVPCSRRSPYFVVLQQVRVDEDAELHAVTKRWHATTGFVTHRVGLLKWSVDPPWQVLLQDLT